MPKAKVCLTRANCYDPEPVRSSLRALLEPLGGMGAFVSRGDRVLVKPNFLIAKRSDKAVTTHPELILAVCEAVLDAGAKDVLIGDSPAFGSAYGVARRIKLMQPAKERGLQVIDFASPVVVEHNDAIRYRRF